VACEVSRVGIGKERVQQGTDVGMPAPNMKDCSAEAGKHVRGGFVTPEEIHTYERRTSEDQCYS
jgi:hypothetical protein